MAIATPLLLRIQYNTTLYGDTEVVEVAQYGETRLYLIFQLLEHIIKI